MLRPDAAPDWQYVHHAKVDPHGGANWLSNFILGSQDGIVNVLAVLLGVAAASQSSRLVFAAGLATAFGEAVSMAAVGYTSTLASADVFRSERAREYRHVRDVPALERAEVREIYERKGFHGDLLDRIVDTITADPDVWVAVMMTEEHHLEPTHRGHALRSAFVVGVAALLGSLVPLVPFCFGSVVAGAWGAAITAGVALFAVGAYKARVTGGRPLRSGAEMAAIGLASALIGWGTGALFGVST
jgi:VIT1/CCC1 family predicted Fe2+/Mn2+ transporter